MTTRNRRKHSRVPAKGVATHFKGGALTAFAMPVDNLSSGGIFIRTDEPLPPGFAIALELLDGAPEQPLKLSGKVVGVVTPEQAKRLGRVAGMGVMFDAMDAATAARLDKLIRRLKEHNRGGPIVDSDMEFTRKEAFDFGFASLENFDFDELQAQQRNSTPPEAAKPKPAAEPRVTPPDRPARDAKKAAPTSVSWQMAPPDGTEGGSAGQSGDGDAARLMVQVRGLLMELSEMQAELAAKDREIAELKKELEKLRRAR